LTTPGLLRLEIAHIGIAVADLDEAIGLYRDSFGVEFTHPFDGAGVVVDGSHDVAFRGAIARTSSAPIELLEAGQGPGGAPWRVAEGLHHFHHVAYWAADVDRSAGNLIRLGWRLEVAAPEYKATGDIGRFAYVRHQTGIRVELIRGADRIGIERWLHGEGDLVLDGVRYG
jgi:methylmalonyl-CoA/ethylmalonyl-CoA epimerase